MAEKLTPAQLEQLSKGCPTLATAKFKTEWTDSESNNRTDATVGELINAIIGGPDDEENLKLWTNRLTVQNPDWDKCKAALNYMCLFNGLKFGDFLEGLANYILVSATAPEKLTKGQIAALDGTCGTLKGLEIGTKLDSLIPEPTPTVTIEYNGNTMTLYKSITNTITTESIRDYLTIVPSDTQFYFGGTSHAEFRVGDDPVTGELTVLDPSTLEISNIAENATQGSITIEFIEHTTDDPKTLGTVIINNLNIEEYVDP